MIKRQQVNRPVDPMLPDFIHSYSVEIPADGVGHSLAELDLGYFTVADDPVGSDRPIRSIDIRVDPDTDPADVLYIGGPYGQAYPLRFGESYGLVIGKLSDVWVQAPGAPGNPITIHVLFIAMDE